MAGFPDDIDLQDFWEDSDFARENITDAPPDDALIHGLEHELGYRLPPSYVAFMRRHNGGIPYKCCFPTDESTSWAVDHVAISSFLSIGRSRLYSLGGRLGSRFMIEEWGYPDLGVYICDCPSAGHDMVALDYRSCGANGEPRVVHVDQESDYRITALAPDFESFVRGLVDEEAFDSMEADFDQDLERINEGSFSSRLAPLLIDFPPFPPIAEALRAVARHLLADKGHFALHADELSYLFYDLQFWVYQQRHRVDRRETFLAAYPDLIALGDGGFSTGGYAPGFVEDWLDARRQSGDLIEGPDGLVLSDPHKGRVIAQLQSLTR